ncbi:MAG: glycosyl transferase family protein [Bryobacteraceae bacterium]
MTSDNRLVVCLVSMAVWILLSSLDDLFIALVAVFPKGKHTWRWPAAAEAAGIPERRIAILVPLWKEQRVIGRMLERNLAAIRYSNYDFFVGAYLNDALTVAAVAEAACRSSRVHLALVPHSGPTSKGDCLNAIFDYMAEYEAARGIRYEVIVTHDAEDVVAPESLRLINWLSRDYQMVQIPVLPLPTGPGEMTHGVYCDEFAEYQQKDIPARQRLGGFLPSNGVGTGFERAALERLAATRGGRIFDPACLTEDYENGFRLHALGCRQIFVPLRLPASAPVATREYFPRRLRAAIRQRSRWVAGIALQGWEHHGWRAPLRQVYFFWRDRKGLLGNLLSPFANLLFLCWLAGWHAFGGIPAWAAHLCAATLGLSLVHFSIRTVLSARVYGWRFAAGVLPRTFWGNLLNSAATISALRQFAAARFRGRTLAWRKTDHKYPACHTPGQGRLGELLVLMRAISLDDLDAALATCPPGVRLGEHLIELRKLKEEQLYQALSAQAGLELGMPGGGEVVPAATRALPAATIRRFSVLPYRVDFGQLHLLTPEVPSPRMTQELAALCPLDLRFRLVRPKEFERLCEQFLG